LKTSRTVLTRAALAGAFAFAVASTEAKRCAAQAMMELGADASWFASMPVVSLADPQSTWLRSVHGGPLVSTGAAVFAGGHLGGSLAVNRHWSVPILSLGVASAAGPSERVNASIDGSAVQLKPWTTWQLTLLGPGVEARAVTGKWLFSASVRGGLSMMWMGVDVAAGSTGENHTASALTGLARAEARGCRRLDPMHRVCLTVAPHVYQYGWLNGVSAGLLWELGP
jgi:hypothetical protein